MKNRGINMKKNIYLVSKSYRIISVILSLIMIGFSTYLIIDFDKFKMLQMIITYVLTLVIIIMTYFNLNMKIKLKDNELVIKSIKKYIVSIDNIDTIYVDTEFSSNKEKYCVIVIETKDDYIVQIPGYFGIKSKNNVNSSKLIVEELKKY